MGRAQRAVPAVRLLGPRPARELLRLVHAAERRAPARRAGAARRAARARADGGARRQALLLGVVGALSLVPWFGKPTFALFTVAQLVAIAVDDELVSAREEGVCVVRGRRRARRGVALALLVICGDALAFVADPARRTCPRFTASLAARARPTSSRTRGARRRPSSRSPARSSSLSLVLLGEMPRAAIALALVPVCALGERRRAGEGVSLPLSPGHRGGAPAVARLRGVARGADARRAPEPGAPAARARRGRRSSSRSASRRRWKTRRTCARSGSCGAARRPRTASTREYFAHFPEADFFPFEMRQAAAYLREHTAPGRPRSGLRDGSRTCSFSRGVSSATPYIYAYDLDVDAALAGGTGGVPDDAQSERIRAIRDGARGRPARQARGAAPGGLRLPRSVAAPHRGRRLGRLRGPLPSAAPWVRAHYRETARFGHDHVWLRTNLAPATPAGRAGTPDEPQTPRPESALARTSQESEGKHWFRSLGDRAAVGCVLQCEPSRGAPWKSRHRVRSPPPAHPALGNPGLARAQRAGVRLAGAGLGHPAASPSAPSCPGRDARHPGERALPEPRALVARVQRAGARRGRRRERPAARAAEVSRDRLQQPRRVLHGPRRGAQAAAHGRGRRDGARRDDRRRAARRHRRSRPRARRDAVDQPVRRSCRSWPRPASSSSSRASSPPRRWPTSTPAFTTRSSRS